MQSEVQGGKSPRRKSRSRSRSRSHSRTLRSLKRKVRRLASRLRRSPSTRYVILPRRTEYKYVTTPYYYGYNRLAAEYADQKLKDAGYHKRPEYRGYECTKGRYDSGLCASGVFPYNPLTGRNEDPHTRTGVGGGRPYRKSKSRKSRK